MELVPLGSSGVLVSRIGLGCSQLGRRIERDQALTVIRAALDAEITHFDTADIYGDSELILGEALAGRREEVVIATKFGTGPGASGSPEYVRAALERSLARLGTDYVDLFYYHLPDRSTPLDETLGALEELRREGTIRAIGCSNLTAQELEYVLAGGVRIDALQNEYNLLSREAEVDILPLCLTHDVAFVPYRPLAQGRLARGEDEQLVAHAAGLRLTPVELAIAALASTPGVASVIAGATEPLQVHVNVTAGRIALTPKQLGAIPTPGIVAPVTVGMIIRMEDVNNSGSGEFFVGSRSRLASTTSVRLLDDRRLVCTNCVGMRMYLVDYDLDTGTYEIRAEAPTVFEGQEVETDLLDVDGRGLIATSNCGATSVSVYRLEDGAIRHVQDVPIRDDEADFCHGVEWVPGRTGVVCATCIGSPFNVYFLSTETGEVLYKFGGGEWIPRDTCFVSPDRLVVAYSRGHPGAREEQVQRESRLRLFSLDLDAPRHELLGEAVLPDCQAESIIHHDGRIYVTEQLHDSVVVCELDGETIEPTLEIPGYSFPHGIDLLPELNLLAVTNYGSNTIMLRQL